MVHHHKWAMYLEKALLTEQQITSAKKYILKSLSKSTWVALFGGEAHLWSASLPLQRGHSLAGSSSRKSLSAGEHRFDLLVSSQQNSWVLWLGNMPLPCNCLHEACCVVAYLYCFQACFSHCTLLRQTAFTSESLKPNMLFTSLKRSKAGFLRLLHFSILRWWHNIWVYHM